MQPEQAARGLQEAIALPAWAASVLLYFGDPKPSLRVWISGDWNGPKPNIPESYCGYDVVVERRPAFHQATR